MNGSPSHDHAHHHHSAAAGRLLWLAAGLTLAYAAVEAGVGWWAGSLALVADAGHMVNDAAALAVNGEIKSTGKVLSVEEIKTLLSV